MNVNSLCKEVTQRKYEARIASICLFIDTHCDFENDMSIPCLAKQCGWTPFHFHRVFRAVVGEPVGHYVRRKRLEYAATFLTCSGACIDDIAERVGYESACVFARAFKKMFGISPGAFKQLRRPAISDARPMQLGGKTSQRSKICH